VSTRRVPQVRDRGPQRQVFFAGVEEANLGMLTFRLAEQDQVDAPGFSPVKKNLASNGFSPGPSSEVSQR